MHPTTPPSSASSTRRRHRPARIVAVVVATFATAVPGVAAAAPCWSPAVAGPVVDPYREPACPYCPGNRGIEYATRPGSAVRAVSAGVVTFAGTVGGTRYVVVRHGNGWRATYGGLRSSHLRSGDPVASRGRIGLAGERTHFGLRVDGTYVDPAPYLGRLVGRPRLVPLDGTASRPAPPPRLRCGPGGVPAAVGAPGVPVAPRR